MEKKGDHMYTLSITTTVREQMINVTAEVEDLVRTANLHQGALVLFCPHTTCGLTINEGADPDVVRDMTAFFRRLIPHAGDYRHREGNSDAHIKASVLGCSLMILVDKGALCLGTWQSLYLYEGDGPRTRSVWLQWLPA